MVEDMTEFLEKREKPVAGPEEAQDYLKSEYNIDITPEQLKKVLELQAKANG